MVPKGLVVRLEAQAGKEEELASFLAGALPLVQDEPETLAWFAVQIRGVLVRDRRRLPRRGRTAGPPRRSGRRGAARTRRRAARRAPRDPAGRRARSEAATTGRAAMRAQPPVSSPTGRAAGSRSPCTGTPTTTASTSRSGSAIRRDLRICRRGRVRPRRLPPPVRPSSDPRRASRAGRGAVVNAPVPVTGLFETHLTVARPRTLGRLLP